ncbi:MAG: hypothetical protein WD648_01550, partial [Planctomycetaceae bacterium]
MRSSAAVATPSFRHVFHKVVFRSLKMTSNMQKLVAVGAFVLGFGLMASAVVLSADPCEFVPKACPGWGVVDPPVQGYCCNVEYNATKSCDPMHPEEVKAVTKNPDTYCGKLAHIVNNMCSGVPVDIGCGALKANVGCISENCGGGA